MACLRTLVPVLALALSVPVAAEAASARVQSLAGHRFLEDETDVVMFPGLLFAYSNRALLDLPPSATDGSGAFLFGNEKILGIWLNRGGMHATGTLIPGAGIGDDFPNYAQMLADAAAVLPADQQFAIPNPPEQLIDVLFGLNNGFGGRLTLSNSITARRAPGPVDPANPEAPPVPVEDGTQATSIELAGGWSLRTPVQATDVGVSLTFNTVKVVQQELIVAESGSTPAFAASGRHIIRMGDRYELGFLGTLSYRPYTVDLPRAVSSVERGDFGLVAGVGPRIQLTEDIRLVANVLAGITSSSSSLKVGEAAALKSGASQWLFPGFDASVEGRATDWFTIRAGFRSRYNFAFAETGSGPTLVETTNTLSEFAWAAGVGFRFGQFTIDGAIEAPLITNGPEIIGGRSTGMFGLVSLAYAFGEVGSVPQSSTPAPAAAPRPIEVPMHIDPPAGQPPRPVYDDPYYPR